MKVHKKIRVLLMAPSFYAVSGVSTHINQLFNSSLSEEYQFLYFQVGSEGRNEGYIDKLGRFIFSPVILAIILIIKQPYIVHLNTSIDPKAFWRDCVYLFIASILRRKIVYQVHGGKSPQEFSVGHRWFRKFLKWVLNLPDATVLLSESQRQAYLSFSSFKSLVVIPNAVNLKEYSSFKVKKFDREKFNLVYIGRFSNSKGIFEAIEAMRILRDRGIKNVALSIVGSGPDEQLFHDKVVSLSLGGIVKLKPPVFGKDKLSFWQRADILIFPTYREGLPYTILESLASGTPMVTTPVGGIPDVVENDVHGILVEPRDINAVADAIMELINDRKKLCRMSAACIERAQEYYGVERLSHQFSELYRSITE